MAITKITYSNKVNINSNSGVADINKINDSDMNQIKTVVNTNADNLGDVANLVGATNVVDALTNMNTYSTSNETMVGVWVDNKPIYRKTFYIQTLPQNNYITNNHNIANIDEMVNVYGIMRNKTNHMGTPINVVGTAAVNGTGNNLIARADRTAYTVSTEGTNTTWTNHSLYLTLEYTKTS